jgi:hypothetical protein
MTDYTPELRARLEDRSSSRVRRRGPDGKNYWSLIKTADLRQALALLDAAYGEDVDEVTISRPSPEAIREVKPNRKAAQSTPSPEAQQAARDMREIMEKHTPALVEAYQKAFPRQDGDLRERIKAILIRHVRPHIVPQYPGSTATQLGLGLAGIDEATDSILAALPRSEEG